MIRAIVYLASEFLWGLVDRITAAPVDDDTPPSDDLAEQARVRAEWVAKHRWPTDGETP